MKLSALLKITWLFFLVNSGFAQESYVFENYNGAQVDRNLIYATPEYNYCQGVQGESLVEFCQLGVSSAIKQAQNGLRSYGMLQGFFVGYSKGLRNGIKATRLSSESVELAKKRVNINHPKIQQQISAHVNEAGLYGLHEGKKRLREFINNQLLIEGQATMPVQPSFSLVNDNIKSDEEVTAPEILLIQNISKRQLGITTPTIDQFLGSVSVFADQRPAIDLPMSAGQVLNPSLSDLFLAGDDKVIFPFDQESWNEKVAAYQRFVDNLVLASDPLINLQQLGPKQLAAFKQGFIGADADAHYRSGVNLENNAYRFGAYELYARFEFAKLFNSMVEKGYVDGVAEGKRLGLELGALENLEEQTNLAYMRESVRRYTGEFIDQYRNSFDSEHRNRKTEFLPIIESVEIIGEFDEQEQSENPIHQPLERFKLKVTVSNAGFNDGKDIAMSLRVAGDDLTSLGEEIFKVKPLSRKVFVTKNYIGQIGKVDFGAKLPFQVHLTTSTTEFDADPYNIELTIKNIVKVGTVKHQVYLSQGFVEADIYLNNVSSTQAEDKDVRVELFVDGSPEIKASSDILSRYVDEDGKTQLSIKLLAFYLDPIKLLKEGYYFEIHLMRSNQLIQKLNVNLNVTNEQKINAAVELLESIMVEDIFIHESYQNETSPHKAIFDDLVHWILNFSRFEGRDMPRKTNAYRDDLKDGGASTILGRLLQLKEKLDETPREFKRYFETLACKLKTNQDVVRWGRGRRIFFKKLLKKINDGDKVKACP